MQKIKIKTVLEESLTLDSQARLRENLTMSHQIENVN